MSRSKLELANSIVVPDPSGDVFEQWMAQPGEIFRKQPSRETLRTEVNGTTVFLKNILELDGARSSKIFSI